MWILVLTCIVIAWAVFKLAKVGKREPTLPPGPPTLPVLGNVHVFPTEFGFFKFTEWAREYGDIFSLKVGPDTVVVITSMKAVKELIDQQSGLTADRPKSYMVETMYEDVHAALMRYSCVDTFLISDSRLFFTPDEKWRLLRKTMHPILTPAGAAEHQPIQAAETTQLMYELLHSPDDFFTHLKRYSTSVITSVVFGKHFPRYECPEMEAIFKSVDAAERVFEYGAHPPVDQLPFLNYIPDRWARWKRMAKWGNRTDSTREENGCFLENAIKKQEEYGLTRKMLGYLGGVLLDGGAHTTSAFLQTLILCLMAYPEVQKKAQAEIDRLVGQGRAPRLEDFDQLPYCQALINETHRFRPVAPMGIPHAMLDEGEYRNYVLPKGTVIFINVWGIYHDPDVYDDPEVFNPDRYLGNQFGTKAGVDVRDFRNNIAFGGGRRICPGMHLGNTSLALNVMNLLWAFDLSPLTDPRTGKPVPVDTFKYDKGAFYAPTPFSCNIKPRSAAKARIIEEEFLAAQSVFEKFEKASTVELEPVDESF
ncbi:hypothetical protein VKT23_008343 [Stygiomarasmius scandens]|uniref:Cytochrome P450 n=1 Tax=Marasmiellus scandens TaxID=2682957 RepID=A0ABR1JIT4_9AGAR